MRASARSDSRDSRENGFPARYAGSRDGEEVLAHNTAGDSAEDTADRVAGQAGVRRAAKRDRRARARRTVAETVSPDRTGILISPFRSRDPRGTDRTSNVADHIFYHISREPSEFYG